MAIETRKYSDRPISITPFGVDCQKFQTLEGRSRGIPIVIGTVKSLEEKYGIEYLIRGFAQVVKKLQSFKRLRLVIAGDGSLKSHLQNLAATLGVESLIEFRGHVSHNQIPELLNSFTVFAALSIRESESFGVAVLEASACGVPVLVSRVGGLNEVVRNDVTGIIVAPRDVTAIANAILRLLDDPAVCARLGAAGRAFVLENYEWSENAQRMENLYLSVSSGAATRALGSKGMPAQLLYQ